MRRFLMLSLLVSSLFVAPAAHAARVENCDKVPHNVTINNGGEEWKITLQPYEHFDAIGPMVTFQMEGQQVITPRWFDDWCIWSGKLSIQRRHRFNGQGRR